MDELFKLQSLVVLLYGPNAHVKVIVDSHGVVILIFKSLDVEFSRKVCRGVKDWTGLKGSNEYKALISFLKSEAQKRITKNIEENVQLQGLTEEL